MFIQIITEQILATASLLPAWLGTIGYTVKGDGPTDSVGRLCLPSVVWLCKAGKKTSIAEIQILMCCLPTHTSLLILTFWISLTEEIIGTAKINHQLSLTPELGSKLMCYSASAMFACYEHVHVLKREEEK